MVVASLVLSAGTLGDIIGRRVVFAAGTALLGLGSLFVLVSSSALTVIAGQAIMGAGGALILPNSLAIVAHAFTDAHERTTAVGIWASVSAVGLAIGPLSAGGLLEVFSWHSVFAVNVVLACLVVALTPVFVADSRQPDRRLDIPGLLLAIVAIASLNYAIIEGGHDGFGGASVAAALVAAAVAAAVFGGVEARSRTPMLDLGLFRNRSFGAASFVAFVGQYGAVGIPILQILYFVRIRHESILVTGLLLLPQMVSYVIVSAVAALVVRRAGFKATITAGLLLAAASALLMVTQQPTTPFGVIAVFTALFGAGLGLILPPATAAAVITVPHQHGGMASATITMFRQVGNTLGASVTATILTSGLATPAGFAESLHSAVLIPGIAGLAAAAAAVAFIHPRPAHH
jgi:DHA2 family multidrug resistance protein-like MFS transporter